MVRGFFTGYGLPVAFTLIFDGVCVAVTFHFELNTYVFMSALYLMRALSGWTQNRHAPSAR